jgi:hypothetical protein
MPQQELTRIFPKPFDISPYICYCIGQVDKATGTKDVQVLMLHGCTKIPLRGTHLVVFLNNGRGNEEIVHSLNSFRRRWFVDYLSFERSTFLLYGEYIVRLSQIRHLIRLPLLSSINGEGPRILSPVNPFVFYPSIRFIKDKTSIPLVIQHIHGLLYQFNSELDIRNQIKIRLQDLLASTEFDPNQMWSEELEEPALTPNLSDHLLPFELPLLESLGCSYHNDSMPDSYTLLDRNSS